MDEKKLRAIGAHETKDLRENDAEIREIYAASIARELHSKKMHGIFGKYLPKEAVLDTGSANGKIFEVLHALGITKTYGADVEDYLTLAKPTEGLKTFDFTVDSFPYQDGSLGGVTSVEVIEHLENPYHYLREVARILKPGGVFILTTPNPDHLWNKISFLIHGKFYRFLDGNNHIMLFAHYVLSKGTLKYFELVKTEYLFGEMPYRIFNRFRWPENKYFGRTVVYVLRKK